MNMFRGVIVFWLRIVSHFRGLPVPFDRLLLSAGRWWPHMPWSRGFGVWSSPRVISLA